jgi:hypothetical protein
LMNVTIFINLNRQSKQVCDAEIIPNSQVNHGMHTSQGYKSMQIQWNRTNVGSRDNRLPSQLAGRESVSCSYPLSRLHITDCRQSLSINGLSRDPPS